MDEKDKFFIVCFLPIYIYIVHATVTKVLREGVIGTEILQTGICFELKAEREAEKNSDQRMWE